MAKLELIGVRELKKAFKADSSLKITKIEAYSQYKNTPDWGANWSGNILQADSTYEMRRQGVKLFTVEEALEFRKDEIECSASGKSWTWIFYVEVA